LGIVGFDGDVLIERFVDPCIRQYNRGGCLQNVKSLGKSIAQTARAATMLGIFSTVGPGPGLLDE
jgi:hypothetical protein